MHLSATLHAAGLTLLLNDGSKGSPPMLLDPAGQLNNQEWTSDEWG